MNICAISATRQSDQLLDLAGILGFRGLRLSNVLVAQIVDAKSIRLTSYPHETSVVQRIVAHCGDFCTWHCLVVEEVLAVDVLVVKTSST